MIACNHLDDQAVSKLLMKSTSKKIASCDYKIASCDYKSFRFSSNDGEGRGEENVENHHEIIIFISYL